MSNDKHASDTYSAHHVRDRRIRLPHIRFHRRQLVDRPLAGEPHPGKPLHWKLYACEAVATGILMIIGIVTNTLVLAPSSPLSSFLLGHPLLQTALAGFFFGSAGTLAAFTRFGKVSGAHLNPSITLAFMLNKKIVPLDALGYFFAQVVGACGGTALVALLAVCFHPWARMVSSVNYVATLPTTHFSIWWSVLAELVLTLLLVLSIYWFAAHKRFRLITPWLGGFYFLVMNPIMAWITGDSTNFVRSLAPDIFSGNVPTLWVYLLGPLLGSALAVLILKSDIFGKLHLMEARIVNFGHHGRVPSLEEPEAVGPAPEVHKPVDS